MSSPLPGYREFIGSAPNGTGDARFYVSEEMLRKLEEYGPAAKWVDFDLVPIAIKMPQVIFRGLSREEYEDGFCYSHVAYEIWADADKTSKIPGPLDSCFLVFVERRPELVIFDWEWRVEDRENFGHPLHWDRDFTRRIWKQQPRPAL